MLLIFLVDALIPHDYMAEHHRTAEETRKARLMRTGALGLGIHNLPEGLASFAGALESRKLGMAIVLATAVSPHRCTQLLAAVDRLSYGPSCQAWLSPSARD